MLFVCAVFGWFVFNKTVDVDSIGVAVKDETKILFYTRVFTQGLLPDEGWTSDALAISFSDMYPTQSGKKVFQLKIVSKEHKEYSLSIGFASPCTRTQEVPISNGEEYYYFGSQVKVSAIFAYSEGESLDVSQNCVGLNSFLVETQPLNGGQVNGVTEALERIPQLVLLQNFNLSPLSEIVFEVQMEFADNGVDQNVYKNFSSNGGQNRGACRRALYAHVS